MELTKMNSVLSKDDVSNHHLTTIGSIGQFDALSPVVFKDGETLSSGSKLKISTLGGSQISLQTSL